MAGPGTYSRFVALLKLALPLTGLILLAALFLVQEQDDIEGGIVFSDADAAALDEGLRIRTPRFFGISTEGDRFSVKAESALPDGPQASSLALERVTARADFNNGSVIDMSANEGTADLDAEILTLAGDLIITTDRGHVVTALEGVANMPEGTILLSGPVNTTLPEGQITSGRAKITALRDATGKVVENQLITFDNGVRVVIPSKDRNAEAQ